MDLNASANTWVTSDLSGYVTRKQLMYLMTILCCQMKSYLLEHYFCLSASFDTLLTRGFMTPGGCKRTMIMHVYHFQREMKGKYDDPGKYLLLNPALILPKYRLNTVGFK